MQGQPPRQQQQQLSQQQQQQQQQQLEAGKPPRARRFENEPRIGGPRDRGAPNGERRVDESGVRYPKERLDGKDQRNWREFEGKSKGNKNQNAFGKSTNNNIFQNLAPAGRRTNGRRPSTEMPEWMDADVTSMTPGTFDKDGKLEQPRSEHQNWRNRDLSAEPRNNNRRDRRNDSWDINMKEDFKFGEDDGMDDIQKFKAQMKGEMEENIGHGDIEEKHSARQDVHVDDLFAANPRAQMFDFFQAPPTSAIDENASKPKKEQQQEDKAAPAMGSRFSRFFKSEAEAPTEDKSNKQIQQQQQQQQPNPILQALATGAPLPRRPSAAESTAGLKALIFGAKSPDSDVTPTPQAPVAPPAGKKMLTEEEILKAMKAKAAPVASAPAPSPAQPLVNSGKQQQQKQPQHKDSPKANAQGKPGPGAAIEGENDMERVMKFFAQAGIKVRRSLSFSFL